MDLMSRVEEQVRTSALSLPSGQLRVVVILLGGLDVVGGLYMVPNFTNIVGAIVVVASLVLLGFGLWRGNAWARALTMAQLWFGILFVIGNLSPLAGDESAFYEWSMVSIMTIVPLTLAAQVYALHILGKFKQHFYKRLI